jgi:lysophospholipase L1-like esterase
MKKVFIYGDSNVWGDNFAGARVPYHLRWVSRLKRRVSKSYVVFTDGLPGRVAGDYRTDKPDRNGKKTFRSSLESIGKVDLVIIALGTNDLQKRFQRTVEQIIDDLSWYRHNALGAEVLYILPPNFDSQSGNAGPEFVASTQYLRDELLKRKADFNAETIELDDLELSDGLHFAPEGHRRVAAVVAKKLLSKEAK